MDWKLDWIVARATTNIAHTCAKPGLASIRRPGEVEDMQITEDGKRMVASLEFALELKGLAAELEGNEAEQAFAIAWSAVKKF